MPITIDGAGASEARMLSEKQSELAMRLRLLPGIATKGLKVLSLPSFDFILSILGSFRTEIHDKSVGQRVFLYLGGDRDFCV